MQQLEKAKAKIHGAKKENPVSETVSAPQPSNKQSPASQPASPTPQPAEFVDQPPFKDDLPF